MSQYQIENAGFFFKLKWLRIEILAVEILSPVSYVKWPIDVVVAAAINDSRSTVSTLNRHQLPSFIG